MKPQLTPSQLQSKSRTVLSQQQLFATTHGYIEEGLSTLWVWGDSCIQALSLRGELIGTRRFGYAIGQDDSKINCVAELHGSGILRNLLCIGLAHGQDQGLLCLMAAHSSLLHGIIAVPEPVTALTIVDHGTKDELCSLLHPQLCQSSGLVALGLEGGQVLLVDLRRDDDEYWPPYNSDGSVHSKPASKDEMRPADLFCCEISELQLINQAKRQADNRKGFHAFKLFDSEYGGDSRSVSALHYCPQLAMLFVGFKTGYLEIWDLKHMSLVVGEEVTSTPITHFLVQQPDDDPANICYLWAVASDDRGQSDDQAGFAVAHLFALEFLSKDKMENYGVLYQTLTKMRLVFRLSMDNTDGTSAATSGSWCLSFKPLKVPAMKGPDREELGYGLWKNSSLVTFTWETWDTKKKFAGTQIWFGVFDLNLWYQYQMPEFASLHSDEGEGNFLMCSQLRQLDTNLLSNPMLDVVVNPTSVKRFTSSVVHEEFSLPSALSFELVCLLAKDVQVLFQSGLQTYLLQRLEDMAPDVLLQPDRQYKQLMNAGLKPSCWEANDDTDAEISSINKLQTILTVALEHGSLHLLSRYATQWAGGSVASLGCTLSFFMNWAWVQATQTKTFLDKLTLPLFDGSGELLSKSDYRLLVLCCSKLKNLKQMLEFLIDKNLVRSENVVAETQQRIHVLGLVSLYTEVLLWSYDCGLLPEACPLPHTIGYPKEKFLMDYKLRRQSMKTPSDLLMIDILVQSCGSKLSKLWIRERGQGTYPPPSIRALLLTYLIDQVPAELKHCLIMYFFFDLAYILGPCTEATRRLVAFPSSFAVRPSLIKLIQALWHLDHEQFEDACRILHSPMILNEDLRVWGMHVCLLLSSSGRSKQALEFLRMRNSCLDPKESLSLEAHILIEHGSPLDAYEVFKRSNASQCDEETFLLFVKKCYEVGQLSKLMRLNFTTFEEQVLTKFLKSNNDWDRLTLFFIMKEKYQEAAECLNSCPQLNPFVFSLANRMVQLTQNRNLQMPPSIGYYASPRTSSSVKLLDGRRAANVSVHQFLSMPLRQGLDSATDIRRNNNHAAAAIAAADALDMTMRRQGTSLSETFVVSTKDSTPKNHGDSVHKNHVTPVLLRASMDSLSPSLVKWSDTPAAVTSAEASKLLLSPHIVLKSEEAAKTPTVSSCPRPSILMTPELRQAGSLSQNTTPKMLRFEEEPAESVSSEEDVPRKRSRNSYSGSMSDDSVMDTGEGVDRGTAPTPPVLTPSVSSDNSWPKVETSMEPWSELLSEDEEWQMEPLDEEEAFVHDFDQPPLGQVPSESIPDTQIISKEDLPMETHAPQDSSLSQQETTPLPSPMKESVERASDTPVEHIQEVSPPDMELKPEPVTPMEMESNEDVEECIMPETEEIQADISIVVPVEPERRTLTPIEPELKEISPQESFTTVTSESFMSATSEVPAEDKDTTIQGSSEVETSALDISVETERRKTLTPTPSGSHEEVEPREISFVCLDNSMIEAEEKISTALVSETIGPAEMSVTATEDKSFGTFVSEHIGPAEMSTTVAQDKSLDILVLETVEPAEMSMTATEEKTHGTFVSENIGPAEMSTTVAQDKSLDILVLETVGPAEISVIATEDKTLSTPLVLGTVGPTEMSMTTAEEKSLGTFVLETVGPAEISVVATEDETLHTPLVLGTVGPTEMSMTAAEEKSLGTFVLETLAPTEISVIATEENALSAPLVSAIIGPTEIPMTAAEEKSINTFVSGTVGPMEISVIATEEKTLHLPLVSAAVGPTKMSTPTFSSANSEIEQSHAEILASLSGAVPMNVTFTHQSENEISTPVQSTSVLMLEDDQDMGQESSPEKSAPVSVSPTAKVTPEKPTEISIIFPSKSSPSADTDSSPLKLQFSFSPENRPAEMSISPQKASELETTTRQSISTSVFEQKSVDIPTQSTSGLETGPSRAFMSPKKSFLASFSQYKSAMDAEPSPIETLVPVSPPEETVEVIPEKKSVIEIQISPEKQTVVIPEKSSVESTKVELERSSSLVPSSGDTVVTGSPVKTSTSLSKDVEMEASVKEEPANVGPRASETIELSSTFVDSTVPVKSSTALTLPTETTQNIDASVQIMSTTAVTESSFSTATLVLPLKQPRISISYSAVEKTQNEPLPKTSFVVEPAEIKTVSPVKPSIDAVTNSPVQPPVPLGAPTELSVSQDKQTVEKEISQTESRVSLFAAPAEINRPSLGGPAEASGSSSSPVLQQSRFPDFVFGARSRSLGLGLESQKSSINPCVFMSTPKLPSARMSIIPRDASVIEPIPTSFSPKELPSTSRIQVESLVEKKESHEKRWVSVTSVDPTITGIQTLEVPTEINRKESSIFSRQSTSVRTENKSSVETKVQSHTVTKTAESTSQGLFAFQFNPSKSPTASTSRQTEPAVYQSESLDYEYTMVESSSKSTEIKKPAPSSVVVDDGTSAEPVICEPETREETAQKCTKTTEPTAFTHNQPSADESLDYEYTMAGSIMKTPKKSTLITEERASTSASKEVESRTPRRKRTTSDNVSELGLPSELSARRLTRSQLSLMQSQPSLLPAEHVLTCLVEEHTEAPTTPRRSRRLSARSETGSQQGPETKVTTTPKLRTRHDSDKSGSSVSTVGSVTSKGGRKRTSSIRSTDSAPTRVTRSTSLLLMDSPKSNASPVRKTRERKVSSSVASSDSGTVEQLDEFQSPKKGSGKRKRGSSTAGSPKKSKLGQLAPITETDENVSGVFQENVSQVDAASGHAGRARRAASKTTSEPGQSEGATSDEDQKKSSHPRKRLKSSGSQGEAGSSKVSETATAEGRALHTRLATLRHFVPPESDESEDPPSDDEPIDESTARRPARTSRKIKKFHMKP